MIIEVILKLSGKIIQFDSESIEEFPVREGSINISNDNNVSSFVKVSDDVASLDLAIGVWIWWVLPLSEVHMTMMWSYLKRS
jgi:hypothetical protein